MSFNKINVGQNVPEFSLYCVLGNKQFLQILPYLYISQLDAIKTDKLVILKKY